MMRNIKRFRFAPLALLLCFFALCAVTFAEEKTVYLSGDATAAADGSLLNPYGDLAEAIAAVADGGRIVVLDEYTVTANSMTGTVPTFNAPAHDGGITVTSLDDGTDYRRKNASLYFTENFYYNCGGPVTFENVYFKNDATNIYLAANFHPIEFGAGFDVKNTQGVAKKLLVIGGYNTPALDLPADKNPKITIENGNFARVIGFTYVKGAATYTFTGTAQIDIRGGHIDRIYGASVLNHYSGNLRLSISGDAQVGDIYLGGDQTRRLSGDAQVFLYGGTIGNFFVHNVLGDTDILLEGAKFRAAANKISVTYGNDTVQKEAYGSAVVLRYNQNNYSEELVKSFDGVTELVPYTDVDAAFAAADKTLKPVVPFVAPDGGRVVFVSDSGRGDGSSAENATFALDAAYTALKDTGGTVVVCGKLSVKTATGLVTTDKTIKMTSVYGGVDYRQTGAKVALGANIGYYCPTVLDDITFLSEKSNMRLVFDGCKTVIGEGVDCEMSIASETHPWLVAGTVRNNYDVKTTDITVNGGKWERFFNGNTSAATFTDVDYRAVIGGGVFYGRTCAAGAGNQTGHIEATVNGGTFYGGLYGLSSLSTENFTGDLAVTINGGVFYGKIKPSFRQDSGFEGSYTLHINGGDFTHLTDIEGDKRCASDFVSTVHIGAGVDLEAKADGTITYQNPLRRSADPRIALVNNVYYYVYTSGSTLSVYKAQNASDLAYSDGELIFDAKGATAAMEGRDQNIWPSELQYFAPEEFGAEYAGWYLFFSTFDAKEYASGRTDGSNRRSYVLKCTSDDLQGQWVNPLTGEPGQPIAFCSDTDPAVNVSDWCAGESTLRYGGKIYAAWIEQRDGQTETFRQILRLAELKNPWTATGRVLTLVEPVYDWEREGYGYSQGENIWYPAVIEGATPIVGDNGELYMLYAASGYWTTGYKVGQMKYLGGDLLDISSWEKSPTAIFAKNSEVNGVGGLSALRTVSGERYIMYHGYLGKDTSSGRYCFLEPYTVDGEGVHFGVDGQPSPLNTVQTLPQNPTPLCEKIGGFDNYEGYVRIKLKIGAADAFVGGARATLDAAPVIKNSRTMLPVRFLAESFGAAVGWDGATSTATVTGKDGRMITIQIGAPWLTVDGQTVPLDSPAYIDGATNRTYLPVRAIAEALGATVDWNGETSTATLCKVVKN
ncbi:MAG: family 43 glycosylhydrolase [Clostridia bacterium]|nr:family 43 glycosylhydrolase [Clostridia bacterium]